MKCVSIRAVDIQYTNWAVRVRNEPKLLGQGTMMTRTEFRMREAMRGRVYGMIVNANKGYI